MTKTYSHAEHHERMVKMAHPDVNEDRGLVKKMVKREALTGRASGGMAPKGKGKSPKSQVNVVIAPRPGGSAPSGMPMPGGPGPTPMPPRPVAIAAPRPPMAPPGGLGGMGPIPAGAKRGGPVKGKDDINAKRGGHMKKRAEGGAMHADDNINARHRGGKAPAKRANGGPLGASPEIAKHGYPEAKRDDGGRMGKDASNVTKPKMMKGYDAGAGGGEGRLEKEKHYGVKAKMRDYK